MNLLENKSYALADALALRDRGASFRRPRVVEVDALRIDAIGKMVEVGSLAVPASPCYFGGRGLIGCIRLANEMNLARADKIIDKRLGIADKHFIIHVGFSIGELGGVKGEDGLMSKWPRKLVREGAKDRKEIARAVPNLWIDGKLGVCLVDNIDTLPTS